MYQDNLHKIFGNLKASNLVLLRIHSESLMPILGKHHSYQRKSSHQWLDQDNLDKKFGNILACKLDVFRIDLESSKPTNSKNQENQEVIFTRSINLHKILRNFQASILPMHLRNNLLEYLKPNLRKLHSAHINQSTERLHKILRNFQASKLPIHLRNNLLEYLKPILRK